MSSFYIPKPCHENWNTMTPQEKGRLCDVCTKVVVDFTKKTPVEVDKIMHEAEGSVCGNFNLSQLDQKAQMKVFKNPSNLFNRNFKYFAMSVFGFFLLNKKAEAQMKGKVAIRGDVAPIDYHDTNTETTTISGTITKHDGKPAGGSEIRIVSGGKEIATATAIANGTYSIKIEPGKIVSRKVNVFVQHDYYETKEVYDLYIGKAVNKLNVSLNEHIMVLGEVAFVEPPVVDTVPAKLPVVDTTSTPVLNNEPVLTDTAATNTTCTQTYSVEGTTTEIPKEIEIPAVNMVVRPEDISTTLYPNPTSDAVTVSCTKQGTYVIGLYNENGALVKTVNFTGEKTLLDIAAFDRGNYFILVRGENGYNDLLKLIKM